MPAESRKDFSGMTRRDFEARLIAKAWKSPVFRRRLLEEPKRVFEEQLGVKLPADLEIKTFEETSEQLYLVLPPNPDQGPELELPDEQLEMVTGGNAMPVFLLGLLPSRSRPSRKT